MMRVSPKTYVESAEAILIAQFPDPRQPIARLQTVLDNENVCHSNSMLQRLIDEIMLRGGISAGIVGNLLLQAFLEFAVACPKRLVEAEDVAQQQVVAPLQVVYAHDVQV